MKIQGIVVRALAVLAFAAPAASAQTLDGFYGGIAIKDPGSEASGVVFGRSVALGLRAPVAEDAAVAQRVFGGYRWRNELAVEAAFARSESYALRPFGAASPGGIGLSLGGRDNAARATWNLDVFGSYTFLRSFALYGRVGYAQSDLVPANAATLLAADARRSRDGVNYGLGLSYDVSRKLGVNLEYTRFGRFAFESFGTTLPENDQVRLGVQFRF